MQQGERVVSGGHAAVIVASKVINRVRDESVGVSGGGDGLALVGAVMTALGFVGWCSVSVRHCHDSHGLVLDHKDGWRLVYSGEQTFCNPFLHCDPTFDKMFDKLFQK